MDLENCAYLWKILAVVTINCLYEGKREKCDTVPCWSSCCFLTPHDGTFYCRQHVGVPMERFLCFLWLMMQRFILFSFKMLVGSYFYKHILTWCTRRSLYSVVMWERSAQPCFKNPSEVTLWVIRLSRVIGLGSRWLNIGHVLFFRLFMDLKTKSRSIKMLKRNKANIQPFWMNKLGQWSIIISKGELFVEGPTQER